MSTEKTTIAISKDLKLKLELMKIHPRQTYEEVIEIMIINLDKDQTKLI